MEKSDLEELQVHDALIQYNEVGLKGARCGLLKKQ
jgi:hypothetical protein